MALPENYNDNTSESLSNATIPAKDEVIKTSQVKLDNLKQTVNPNVEKNIAIIRANFSLEKAQQIIHDIEGIDAQKFPRERRMALSQFLGVLAVAGYHVVFEDGRNVKVLGNAKDLPYKAEIETLLSQFVDGKAQNRNDLKTAIVYRSRSVENFIDSQRDGKLDVDGKDYLFFLLKKYGYRTPTHQPGRSFVNSGLANRVANDKKIPAEDKTFMVSCLKNPYFPGFSLKDELQDYQEMRKVPGFEELKKELLTFDASQNPAGKKPTNNAKGNPISSPQTPVDGKNPPFDATKLPGERGTLDNMLNAAGSTPLGAAGPLILIIGAIYALFKYPKVFLAGAAGLGLYAWKPEMFGEIMDKAGNKVDNYTNREKGPDNSQKPAVNPQSPQTEAAKNNPNKIRSKKETMYAGFESVDKNTLEGAYSWMLSSKELEKKPVAELQNAYEKKTLPAFFASIKEIGGTTGTEFYKKYSAVTVNGKAENLLELLIGKLLQTRDAKDVIVGDLFVDGQLAIKTPEQAKQVVEKMRSENMTDLMILFRMTELGWVPESFTKGGAVPKLIKWIPGIEKLAWVDAKMMSGAENLSNWNEKLWGYLRTNPGLVNVLVEEELKNAKEFEKKIKDKTSSQAEQIKERIALLDSYAKADANGAAFDGQKFVKEYLQIADKMPTFSIFMSANQQKIALEKSILEEGVKDGKNLSPEQKAILDKQQDKFTELQKHISEHGIDHVDTQAKIAEYEKFVREEVIKDQGLKDARIKIEKSQIEAYVKQERAILETEKRLIVNQADPTTGKFPPEFQARLDHINEAERLLGDSGYSWEKANAEIEAYRQKTEERVKVDGGTAEVRSEHERKQQVEREARLEVISKDAEALDKKLMEDLSKLDAEIQKDPTKKAENEVKIKQLIEEANTKRSAWSREVGEAYYLTPEAQRAGYVEKTSFGKQLASVNGWIDKAGTHVPEAFKTGGRYAFKGAVYITMAVGARNIVASNDANFLAMGKDFADMGIGMIPVVGWAWDLYFAYQGKDINDRTMTTNERWMRTGFGVLGLIPGVGLVAKGAKALTKGAKVTETSAKMARTGYAAVEIVNTCGKVGNLAATGLSVYIAGTEIHHLLPTPTTKVTTPQK